MLNTCTPNCKETRSVSLVSFMSAKSICQECSARMRPFGALPNRLTRPHVLVHTPLPGSSAPVGSRGGEAKAAGLMGSVWFCTPPRQEQRNPRYQVRPLIRLVIAVGKLSRRNIHGYGQWMPRVPNADTA